MTMTTVLFILKSHLREANFSACEFQDPSIQYDHETLSETAIVHPETTQKLDIENHIIWLQSQTP